MTTSIASVDGMVRVIGFRVIWVRVAYAVRADSLHKIAVFSPILGPVAHVMVGWVVDTAMISFAIRL